MCYTNVHWWILLFLRACVQSGIHFLEKKQAFCWVSVFGMFEKGKDGMCLYDNKMGSLDGYKKAIAINEKKMYFDDRMTGMPVR